MMPLTVLSASNDTNASVVTLPKSYIVPYFDHVGLRHAILPLTMLLVSHDADAKANGIKRPKKSCHTSNQSS